MKKVVNHIRLLYLKHIKWKKFDLGSNFYAGLRVKLWAKTTLKIGKNFYIGRDSQIETDCIIGDNVIFGNKVAMVGKYDHHFQQPGVPIRLASRIRDEHYNWKGLHELTVIEDDVWVGYGAIIMSGVRIRKGCIIATGAVLTKNTEPYGIYAGNPAVKIKDRFDTKADLEQHIKMEASILGKYKNYKGLSGIPDNLPVSN